MHHSWDPIDQELWDNETNDCGEGIVVQLYSFIYEFSPEVEGEAKITGL